MRRHIALLALLVLGLPAATAQAAGQFDGDWSGEVAGTSGPVRACTNTITRTVQNNFLHGQMKIGKFSSSDITGSIGNDGTFNSAGGRVTGKFQGNSFTGGFSVPNGYCNPYKITMSRS